MATDKFDLWKAEADRFLQNPATQVVDMNEFARRIVELVGEVRCRNELGRCVWLPMLLWCPCCQARHIDEGEWAKAPHHTHACQHCGMVWRPAVENTVGVRFLPGFQNVEVKVTTRWSTLRAATGVVSGKPADVVEDTP